MILVGDVPAAAFGCGSVTLAATHDNGLDLDNEEQGAPIQDKGGSWSQLWPRLRHLS